jgi:hypothetical protein
MVAFWPGRTRKSERLIDEELQEFDKWIDKVREPRMSDDNVRRLESEIYAKRNKVMDSLTQRFVRPRQNKITDIRREVDVLRGMVLAYLYVSGKWDKISTIGKVTEDVNDLAMLYLSVDLIKMDDRAYPKKAPRDV